MPRPFPLYFKQEAEFCISWKAADQSIRGMAESVVGTRPDNYL